MLISVSKADVKDVLMDPKAPGLKELYFIINGDSQNVTIIAPGRNGLEYNKTHGFFHSFQGAVIYQCLWGQGVLLMQRNDELGEAKEFKVITLNSGRQIEVPAGYAHTVVNIGKNFLVVVDNSPVSYLKENLIPLKQKRGLAYYVVEKKGEVGFEPNPNYRVHPQISTE